MAKNASNLTNSVTGKKAYIDGSGNVVTPGTTGTYTQCGAVRIYGLSTAITADTTATTAPAGSLGLTTHATGKGKIFYSDGTKWQFAAVS